jgi:hypothetical protein
MDKLLTMSKKELTRLEERYSQPTAELQISHSILQQMNAHSISDDFNKVQLLVVCLTRSIPTTNPVGLLPDEDTKMSAPIKSVLLQ